MNSGFRAAVPQIVNWFAGRKPRLDPVLQDEASGSNVPSRPLPGMEDSEAAVSTLEEDVRCNISIMQITLSYPGFSF